jgi:hypothetical protein
LGLGILAVLSFNIWQSWQLEVMRIGPPKMEFRAARETFPFSVIPGGIMNSRELSDSMQKDDVVREHYLGVNPSGMRFIRLKQPMIAYVSFRNGSRIGWTTHPVTIAANELVLTDGKKMVRARCGNRIEVERPEPLPAMTHLSEPPPPDIAMDTGSPGLIPPTIETPLPPRSAITLARNGTPEQLITVPGTPTTRRPPTTTTPPTSVPPTSVVPPGWCCGIVDKPKPPTHVPEPGSLLLLGAGGWAILLAARKLRLK